MDTTFDILQAIGLGVAFGLRPALAPLVVAICAVAGLAIDLDGTAFEFLTEASALIVLAVFAAGWIALNTVRGMVNHVAVLVIAVALAAMFGGGGYDEHAAQWWPGALAGGLAALVTWFTLSPLLAGAARRVAGEKEASMVLPVVTELVAIVVAFLSIVFPPLAVVALIAVLVLTVRGRGRDDRYAGLRTLG